MSAVRDMTDLLDLPDEPKPWWQSRGIIGSLVTISASLAALAGYALDVEGTTELAMGLATLIGGALAWWGRVKAMQPISTRKVLPGVTIGGRP